MGNQTDKEWDIFASYKGNGFTIFSSKNQKTSKCEINHAKRNLKKYTRKDLIRMKTWKEVRLELYTYEEIRESDLRVSIIGELIKTRQEKTYLSENLKIKWF